MLQKKHMDNNTHVAKSYDEFKDMIETGGFVLAHWDGTVETENKIKQDSKATIRCIPFHKKNTGKCIVTCKSSECQVFFAKSY